MDAQKAITKRYPFQKPSPFWLFKEKNFKDGKIQGTAFLEQIDQEFRFIQCKINNMQIYHK